MKFKCVSCGRFLTFKERKYYGNSCNVCEHHSSTEFELHQKIESFTSAMLILEEKIADDRTKEQLQEENRSLRFVLERSKNKDGCWCTGNYPKRSYNHGHERIIHSPECQIAIRIIKNKR